MTAIGRPLFIVGAPRSGTSLTAHAFRACGVWAGHVSSLCEHVELKNEVLKPMLRAGGMDDVALRSFADVSADPELLRARVEKILLVNHYPKDGRPWMFKDVKLVFCWRSWAAAFPDAVWVYVWRQPGAVIESFGRWLMNVKFDGPRVVEEHQSRALQIPDVRVLSPDLLMSGDSAAYEAVADAIGVPWDPAAVAGAVDPRRFHAEPVR